MRKIHISSVLTDTFRDELERIVFFNREQSSVAAGVVESVHRYGVPMIIEVAGKLRFSVKAFGMLQTLYALDTTEAATQLAGVAMFTRESPMSMLLLHLAVHEDYTSQGKWAATGVVAQLIVAIRNVASRTHGIRRLRALYPHEIRFALVKCSDGSRTHSPRP
jgi:hypothetical protein